MARFLNTLLIVGIAASLSGCRNCNRCGGVGNANTGGFFQPLATTVPSPQTYSLQNQTPRTAANQDYYTVPNNGSSARQPNPVSNPNPNLSPQQGWRQVDPSSSGTSTQPSSSILTASNSQTFNTDYRTTSVNESRDTTRLAVTDATQVRAPARFFPTGSTNRPAQTHVATSSTPGAYPYPNQLASLPTPVRTGSGAIPINGTFEYSAQPRLASGSATRQNSPYAQTNVQQLARDYNPPVTSTQPTVLAQATAQRSTSVASNSQWRNSDPGATNFNR